jgi:hypothetical protein
LIDLGTKRNKSQNDNSDYASRIANLEPELASVNTTICMLQDATTYTTLPHVKPIELPHPTKFSGDHKELLNFISTVC